MKTIKYPLILLMSLLLSSHIAFAADDEPEPEPTQNTKVCKKGKVWDEDRNKCIKIKNSQFSDDQIFQTARELAYADRFDDAISLLNMAANADDPRILNYLGFSNRKAGNVDLAMEYYSRALVQNPDYVLARSYMGQGYVAMGKEELARDQLNEIAIRDSRSSWAYRSLASALNANSVAY